VPRSPTPAGRALSLDVLGVAALAAGVAALLAALGPPGVDLAAHDYLRRLYLAHGLVLWDSRWYDGRIPFFSYSVLYYPLAAAIGNDPLSVVSIAVGAGAFDALVARRVGRRARAAGWVFAPLWGAVELSAADPFLLGAAFALVALVLWSTPGRPRWALAAGGVAAAAALASSSLAFLGLAFCIGGAALARALVAGERAGRPRLALARAAKAAVDGPTVVVGALVLCELAVLRAFPLGGFYPFWWENLLEVLVAAGVGVALWPAGTPTGRALRAGALLYGALAVVAFVVPTDLGANLARLRDAALALGVLLGVMRQWRPRALCAVVLVGAAWWNLWPVVSEATAAPRAEATAAYWAPAVRWLAAHNRPDYRVEAVDTAGHWPADYLAGAGIPLVRGWFRQDDFPGNSLLYRPHLTAAAYRRWLRANGVDYVLLTDAPLDFSSVGEAALLRSGRSGLWPVWSEGPFQVFALPHPTPIVVGPHPAAVERAGLETLVVDVTGPGTYRLAVRPSAFWQASRGCLGRGASDGVPDLTLRVRRPGRVWLRVGLSWPAVVANLTGTTHWSCAGPSGRESRR